MSSSGVQVSSGKQQTATAHRATHSARNSSRAQTPCNGRSSGLMGALVVVVVSIEESIDGITVEEELVEEPPILGLSVSVGVEDAIICKSRKSLLLLDSPAPTRASTTATMLRAAKRVEAFRNIMINFEFSFRSGFAKRLTLECCVKLCA